MADKTATAHGAASQELVFAQAFRDLVASYIEQDMSIEQAVRSAQGFAESPVVKMEVAKLNVLDAVPRQPSLEVSKMLDGKGRIPLAEFSDGTAVVYRGGKEPFVIAHGYDRGSGIWSYGDYSCTHDLAAALNRADPDVIEPGCFTLTKEDVCHVLETCEYAKSDYNVQTLIDGIGEWFGEDAAEVVINRRLWLEVQKLLYEAVQAVGAELDIELDMQILEDALPPEQSSAADKLAHAYGASRDIEQRAAVDRQNLEASRDAGAR